MRLFTLGGPDVEVLQAVARALELHPSLKVTAGPGPARFYETLREAIAVRAKDPAKPWDPDPDWVGPFVLHTLMSATPMSRTTSLIVDKSAHLTPTPADPLARTVFLSEGASDERCLYLPWEQLRTDEGVTALFRFLEIEDVEAVRAELKAVPAPTAAPRPSGPTPNEWIDVLSKDEVPPALAEARRHPDPSVRAAMTRWMVRKGCSPEAAEILCNTRLVDWHLDRART